MYEYYKYSPVVDMQNIMCFMLQAKRTQERFDSLVVSHEQDQNNEQNFLFHA